MTDPAGPGPGPVGPPPDLGRAAISVSAVNMVSRISGFARVVATGAALGIATLGDTYQSANVVSNVLFEMLAGGLLFAVLVPAFVGRVAQGDRGGARRLGDVLVGRAMVALGAVAVVGVVLSPLLARALFVSVKGGPPEAQVELATVLLWFVLPQIVLYGVGSVLTALLQADHRFVAASAAPVANNLVVIATMVTFAAVHGTGGGLDLSTVDQVILGGGTLLGTVAMTGVVVVAARRGGLSLRPRWHHPDVGPLGPLVHQGLWAAGYIGLNQVLVLSTVVLANDVPGGAIAFTTAFTVFLLPHAVLAHPVVTTLSPRLAAHAHQGQDEAFAADLGRGLRLLLVILAPSAALMAVLARPGLQVVAGVGALDSSGLSLVATALAGFSTALVGYSIFFLLTRSAYAINDAAGPTKVNLVVTAVSVGGMVLAAASLEGPRVLAAFGLVQGVALSLGALAMAARLRRRTRPVHGAGAALLRGLAAAAAGGLPAWAVVAVVGDASRATSLLATGLGGLVGSVGVIGSLRLLRAPELGAVLARIPGRSKPAPVDEVVR
ncbi:hypothetical protein BH24ACT4_BH24ACT4_01810 [soil metagenome]